MNKSIIKIVSLTAALALISSTSVFADEKINKDEAVYINLNSKGNVINTTVSDWLHSGSGFSNFKDTTLLKNILNVKGNETPRLNGTTAVWNSAAADIFYQGNTDKSLPLSFQISYKLDGADIDPKDIAGKTGKAEIRIKIVNNDKQVISIRGEKKTIYTPFITAAIVSLPMDNFKNISLNSGEMISDGNNNIITFASIPGLKESFGIEDKDNKIPEELVINTEAYNFSLPSIAITSTCQLPNIDEIDAASSIDELQDGISDLKDASNKVLNGIGTLKEGANQLNSGIGSLYGGVSDLYSGSLKLKEGANGIYTGLNSAKSGSNQLYSGLGQLKSGSYLLNEKSKDLYTGAVSLNKGLADLNTGIGTISDVAGKLVSGTASVKNGYTAQMNGCKELEKNLEDTINKMSDTDPYKPYLQAELKGLKDINSNSEAVLGGINQVEAGINGVNGGLLQSKAGTLQLVTGSKQLMDGSYLINGGLNSLYAGISDASNGASSLNSGLGQLYAGSAGLNSGSKNLSSGLLTAKKGTADIKNGSNELYNGTTDLKANYEKFNTDGILQLSDKLDDKIDDINMLLDEKDEIVKLSKDYKVFSGSSENVDGSTKFIFKTEEIKAPVKVKTESKVNQVTEPQETRKGGFFSWLTSLFK